MAAEYVLEMRDITKKYGENTVLSGVSLKVRPGEIHALLGCILFHLLFIVAPSAGKNLFDDAAIGEYFRVFVSYGVIAMALVMHAWSGVSRKKRPESVSEKA